MLVAIGAFVVVRLLFRDSAEPVSVAEASCRFQREHPDAHGGEGPLTSAEGVYLYRGSGTDRLSILSLEETQGPTMPATVTHDRDDCWTLRIDFNDKHWQSWRYCVGDDTITAFAFRRRRERTGSQTGTEHTELWIVPNGMPVRTKRSIELSSGSPVGNIRYHEDTQYRRTSLTPQG